MSDYGIKPEWASTWRDWQSQLGLSEVREMADLAVHLLAGWMRERFEREHADDLVLMDDCRDMRHDYTDDDWLAEARKELGK